jgi:biopolymer transport protein ExbD
LQKKVVAAECKGISIQLNEEIGKVFSQLEDVITELQDVTANTAGLAIESSRQYAYNEVMEILQWLQKMNDEKRKSLLPLTQPL